MPYSSASNAETYACALAYGHAGECSPNPDMGLCARQAYALEGGCGKSIPRVIVRAEKLMRLVNEGVPVVDALEGVAWSLNAAYRWALRHRREDLINALREEYNLTMRARYHTGS